MKNFLFLSAAVCVFLIQTSSAEDYVLTINGENYELGLDKEIPVELEDGTKLQVKLGQKEYITFHGNGYRFEHHKSLLPSVSDLGDGVVQLLMVTPRGTGVMIQTYDGVAPHSLVDVMINEFTKEEVAVGYEFARQKATRKVGDKVFRGAIATTTSRQEDSQWVYEVVAYGDEDGGMMIMTFMEKDNKAVDSKVHERFWNTVHVDMD